MNTIIICIISSIHFSVKYIKLKELEILKQKLFTKSIEEKRRQLIDELAFPNRTTKCENVLLHIAKPKVVSKAFRSNIKATINDYTKNSAIALKECRDLHIYERLKKGGISPCYSFLKYEPKRYSCYKNGNDQLFMRNEDSFHKRRKIYSVVQNSILFFKNNWNIGKWLFFEETAQSVALIYS